MKPVKASVLEAPAAHRLVRHDTPDHEGPYRERISEGWRLPSGAGLAEFALQSGFLASRLWEESQRLERHRQFVRPGGRLPVEMSSDEAR